MFLPSTLRPLPRARTEAGKWITKGKIALKIPKRRIEEDKDDDEQEEEAGCFDIPQVRDQEKLSFRRRKLHQVEVKSVRPSTRVGHTTLCLHPQAGSAGPREYWCLLVLLL